MVDQIKAKSGPPARSTQQEFYDLQDYYIIIESVRYQNRRNGKKLSVAKTCLLVANGGGLAWILGGATGSALEQIAQFLDGLRGKGRRYEIKIKPENGANNFVHDDKGNFYVFRLLQHVKTIEARYWDAARFARKNPSVKFTWGNMVREQCGLPRQIAPRIHPPYRIGASTGGHNRLTMG
jgi:hypothetical protein